MKTYVGGEEEGVRGRPTEDKAIVAVAAEEHGRGIGRIRLRRGARRLEPESTPIH